MTHPVKLLVTGASGFVGGRLWERATAAGHEVVGIGRRKLDRPGYLSVDLGVVGAEDLPELPWRPDAVIHCAARATPYAPRKAYERDNVTATRTVVDWCARLGAPRLVHVSSSSVLYRDGDQLDLTEDSPVPTEFANDYARTKAASEGIVRTYGGSWVIARPRAVFGPGDTVLFPRIIAAAKAGRVPRLTGRSTPAVGDLIYVDNLADYLLQLAGRPELGGVYHLTNAEPVEIQAMLLDVIARLGFAPPTREVSLTTAMRAAGVLERAWRLLRLPGEPPITPYGVGVLSWSKTFVPDKMLRDLGPPAVPVAQGVEEFVAWQKERL
ncbi:NAD-dependent epimerase/dehydratase family protein [Nocardioides daeguensis]|uniref:NAD(P)-dependent oxidoreductase n=1 Tax=Nocardioides daeguensis TaxID=908359 RepID=A0ABP6V1L1_9ACTN|nr:NAD(P)-dependent oxidoreductase [Nocardioides daeguensis]MBV6727123.1 NAD(P)-dependent oxidoreductase [Nocardioides daeguensis]MCR1771474.1 NAD(P)-dependent oxidoreductase [Nocardioides daeguensis]